MLKIVVRSKRDADAVRAMLRVFYSEWNIDIVTLHGARDVGKALDVLSNLISSANFITILLGREDTKLAKELQQLLPPNVSIHVVPRAKVRNTRIEHLAHEFAKARAKLRLGVKWLGDKRAYRFSFCGSGEELEEYGYDVAYDSFLLYGSCIQGVLRRVLNTDIEGSVLMVRQMQGLHSVYVGRDLVATLRIPDEGLVIDTEIRKHGPYIGPSIAELLKVNTEVIYVFEKVSKHFLERYRDWADYVIVPWSGGKDSTVALLLALDVFPRNKVIAIYTDTGVEFPQTKSYIRDMVRKLRVKLVEVYAGIDRVIKHSEKPIPDHENRWCTAMKIEATEKAISEIAKGNTLVVIGDRDAESEARAQRPPVRKVNNLLYVAPIKFWGTTHVQLYLLYRGVKPNPLYELGFYRIGCYICPSLRSWELNIILSHNELKEVRESDLFKKFLRYKGVYGNQT